MSFEVTEHTTRLCRPHKHGAIVTACDKPTSIRTEHHCIYDGFMCMFTIAFLILELVGHDKLGVNTSLSGRAACKKATSRYTCRRTKESDHSQTMASQAAQALSDLPPIPKLFCTPIVLPPPHHLHPQPLRPPPLHPHRTYANWNIARACARAAVAGVCCVTILDACVVQSSLPCSS